jgi:undecaprenyl-diphosphatase
MPSPIALHVVLLAVGGLALVAVLAALVTTGVAAPIDHAIIHAIRDPELARHLTVLRPITELGSTPAVTIIAAVTVVAGVAIGPWIHGVIGAAVIVLASLGTSILKVLIARERPDLLEPIVVERGFAFPSGHSALGMVAWGILAVLISRSRLPVAARRAIVAGAAVIVFLIGVSRIWLGVHYPTDVVAGWIAGATIVLGYAEITRAVSSEPAAAAVDADPGAPRSDPPAAG